MRADDENEVLSNASFLHSSADVSKEYFYELSKEFGTLEGEEEEPMMLYAPQRKGAAMKSKLSRHLINTVRSNPEIESFYRFVAENDLRHEALAILEETLKNKAALGKGAKKVLEVDIFKELDSKAKMRAKASEAQETEEEIEEAKAKTESEDEELPGQEKKKKSQPAISLKEQKTQKKLKRGTEKATKKIQASSKKPVKKLVKKIKTAAKKKAKGKKK